MIRDMKLAILAAALPALLGACVNVIPQPEAPEALYRFGPMEPVHTLSATLVVREPEASRLFSGRLIAVEDGDGALRIVPGIQWTDSATSMMQTALLDTLGGQGSHVAVPSDAGAPAQFELAWRISDFTLSGDTARCRLEATLLEGRRRSVLSQTTVATSAVALNSSNPARAKALTDAGRACVSEIAAFVADATITVED